MIYLGLKLAPGLPVLNNTGSQETVNKYTEYIDTNVRYQFTKMDKPENIQTGEVFG